jgi:hypothetical protein
MILSRRKRKRAARCHLRSECKAKSNKRFFKKMFSTHWKYIVIKHDPDAGDYKMTTA